MTRTRPGADVHGFYATLGIELPDWARTEAPARCFADPDAHKRQDRDPSCSVNLASGAFNCHGCGAHGGAYDAALATGRSPRDAIDLMIAHGLTQRRDRSREASPASTRDTSPTAAGNTSAQAQATRRDQPAANATTRSTPLPAAPKAAQSCASARPPSAEPSPTRDTAARKNRRQLREYRDALLNSAGLIARLRRERGWNPDTLKALGIGFDGHRITVPIIDEHQALHGILRLRVDASQQPKVLAAPGTKLGLIPHPHLEPRQYVLLVEGPSDMLAARSAGLPAIAVPGTHAWRGEWSRLLAGREVTVVMDCDPPGRQAAQRIARDLEHHAARVRIVDLAPQRRNGYDLSDWLKAGNDPRLLTTRSERHRRLLTAERDGWTIEPRVPQPPATATVQPRRPSAAATASVSAGTRGMGCAAF